MTSDTFYKSSARVNGVFISKAESPAEPPQEGNFPLHGSPSDPAVV